jgi:hypothetical protein
MTIRGCWNRSAIPTNPGRRSHEVGLYWSSKVIAGRRRLPTPLNHEKTPNADPPATRIIAIIPTKEAQPGSVHSMAGAQEPRVGSARAGMGFRLWIVIPVPQGLLPFSRDIHAGKAFLGLRACLRFAFPTTYDEPTVCIPGHSGHRFHGKPATHSRPIRPLIPREAGHLFQGFRPPIPRQAGHPRYADGALTDAG